MTYVQYAKNIDEFTESATFPMCCMKSSLTPADRSQLEDMLNSYLCFFFNVSKYSLLNIYQIYNELAIQDRFSAHC